MDNFIKAQDGGLFVFSFNINFNEIFFTKVFEGELIIFSAPHRPHFIGYRLWLALSNFIHYSTELCNIVLPAQHHIALILWTGRFLIILIFRYLYLLPLPSTSHFLYIFKLKGVYSRNSFYYSLHSTTYVGPSGGKWIGRILIPRYRVLNLRVKPHFLPIFLINNSLKASPSHFPPFRATPKKLPPLVIF